MIAACPQRHINSGLEANISKKRYPNGWRFCFKWVYINMDILEKEKISSIKPVHYTGKTCKSAVSIHAVEIEKELPCGE